ncbi:MAG: hypothetical protein E4G94_01435 [ANME-2 cluster archaeon]|nr:MAG: hypothetical protein E4G94_01435 [ANME-2 cluster archaeon]
MDLDLEAARTAQDIIKETNDKGAKDVENFITKTLGVLQVNGVYACILYLYSRSSDSNKVSKSIRKQLIEMTKLVGQNPANDDNAENVLKYLTDYICTDINTLMLTKQIWEQTLVYARYGAKAREK